MHGFALLAFGGLAVALAVRLVSSYGRDMARASNLVLWLGLGVGYAYLADFSIFSAWGFDVRSHAIGAIVTGFMTGGMAMLWEEAIAYVQHFARPANGSKPLRRAA